MSLTEATAATDLVQLITDYFPDAVPNPRSRRIRCVWRGGTHESAYIIRTRRSGKPVLFDPIEGRRYDGFEFLTEIVGLAKGAAARELYARSGLTPSRPPPPRPAPNVPPALMRALCEADPASGITWLAPAAGGTLLDLALDYTLELLAHHSGTGTLDDLRLPPALNDWYLLKRAWRDDPAGEPAALRAWFPLESIAEFVVATIVAAIRARADRNANAAPLPRVPANPSKAQHRHQRLSLVG